MAEDYNITIPVTLSMAEARTELRQFLDEAAKGVVVPVRTGVGGSNTALGASPAPTSIAAAEQAAVRDAMDRAQRQAGYGASAAYAYSATSTAPGGPPNWMNPFTQQQMAPPAQMAPTSSPNWSYYFGQLQNQMAQMAPTSSPNWSYLLNQGRGQQGPQSLIPNLGTYGRAFVGLRAVTAAVRAIDDTRQGDERALFADTPEAANLARTEGLTSATSSTPYRLIFAAPELMNMPGTPAALKRQAEESVAIRRIQEETGSRVREVGYQQRIEDARSTGGANAATREEIRTRAQERDSQTATALGDARDKLERVRDSNASAASAKFWGDIIEKSGTIGGIVGPIIRGVAPSTQLESTALGNVASLTQKQQADRRNEQFQLQENNRDRIAREMERGQRTGLYNLEASGAGPREIERNQLFGEYLRKGFQAYYDDGWKGVRATAGEGLAALGAMGTRFNREDQAARLRSDQELNHDRMVMDNRSPRALERQSIDDRYARQLPQYEREFGKAEGDQRNERERRGAQGSFNFTAIMEDRERFGERFFTGAVGGLMRAGQTIDQFREFNRSAAYQQIGLAQLLGNNPEGAALTGVRGQTDQQVESARFMPWGIRQLTQGAYRAIGGLREQLVEKEYREQRFETGDRIDEETRASRYREIGTPQARVSEIIDRIKTDTARDARRLEEEHDPLNAVKRRTQGVQQLHEAQADFYRSIQFQEVSGGRIAAGRGNPFDGIDKQFRDAEGGIGKSKDGGPAANGSPTSDQMQQLINLLTQFVNKNFKAKAS